MIRRSIEKQVEKKPGPFNGKGQIQMAHILNGQEYYDGTASAEDVGIKALDDYTRGKSMIFTTEVGQHQIFAAQELTLNNSRKLIASCGAGTMGFGLPAAIGASIAQTDATVVCIAGDGSLQMNIQELATCADLGLPVKIFIMNNGYLGMVRQLQEKRFDGRYSETAISNPDFLKLAESYGLKALRITQKNELKKAFDFAFNTKGTVLVDFQIEPMETV